MVAEDHISSVLQQSGILVAKPKFDRLGADLFAMNSVEEPIHLCRIQCKGRSLRSSDRTPIKIRREYVSPSFVVFLYVDIGELGRYHLYCFFADDLKKKPWKEDEKGHVLWIDRSSFQEKLKDYVVDDNTIDRVGDAINHADASEELRYVFRNQGLVDVRVDKVGELSVPIIVYGSTRTERTGTACPGSPDDYDYDPLSDAWTVK